MLDLESISTIVFLVVLGILVVIDWKNIEFKYGIFIRRTKKGKELIYYIGRKYKRFFNYFGSVGAIIGIIASLIAFYFIAFQAFNNITNPKSSVAGLKLIIPNVPSTAICSYVICVPFWFWIIGILVVLVSHEMCHAFVSRAANIRIKSFGLISILVLPGAFVEPDENQLKKASSFNKIKIYAAGGFANLLVFFVVWLASGVMIANLYVSNGVQFASLVEKSPAEEVNLTGTIQQINNVPINNLADFENYLNKLNSGEPILIKTTNGTFNLTTSTNPKNTSKAFIGVSNLATNYELKSNYRVFSGMISWILQLFVWLELLNLGVGIFNLLPLKPLDGGLIYEEIMKLIFGMPKPQYVRALSIITFVIILLNIFGPYLPQILTLT